MLFTKLRKIINLYQNYFRLKMKPNASIAFVF